MTQIATVEKILRGGRAEISVPRKSACGHDCESCSGCGMQGSSTHAVALNPIGAQAGQKVVVESSNKRLYGVMLLVYAVPIVLFLIGYFASYAHLRGATLCRRHCGVLPRHRAGDPLRPQAEA